MGLVLDEKPFVYDGTAWYETVGLTLSNFRSAVNKPMVAGLFFEKAHESRALTKKEVYPIFTIDTDYDLIHTFYSYPKYLETGVKEPFEHRMYSMKRLYLAHRDPQEYVFAESVLGSWDHWTKIATSKWARPYIEKWRLELEIKLRSESVQQLYKKAMSGDVNAGKFISSTSWKHIYRPAGKPSKTQVQAEAQKEAMFKKELSDDYERILDFTNIQGNA